MKKRKFKVSFIQDRPDNPEYREFTSHYFISSEDKDRAEDIVVEKQEGLIRAYGKPEDISRTRIRLLGTEDLGEEEDWLLELWWNIDPDKYLKYWEPEITGKAMLSKLKKKEPEYYAGLIGY